MSYATLHTPSGVHRLNLILASTFFSRLRGLMFRATFPNTNHAIPTGLLITHCASIHTCFMRFPIDVLYLSADGTLLQCVSHLSPWRFSLHGKATHVLELDAGSIHRLGIQPGHRLVHPYFQVAKTCSGLRYPVPRKQRGSTLVEFAWAAPIITLLGLATLQYGLLFFAKNQINHAAFMAARAGSMGHASLNTINTTYIEALIPLYGGGRNSQELAQSYARARTDISGNVQIQLLNPTKESFDDWNDPALQAQLGLSHRVIPFASQEFKNAGDIRPQSGQNIFDANILKIQIVHGYAPQVPLMKTLYTTFMNWYDPHTDAFQTQLLQKGRIPIVTSITIHMQSDAIESDNPISNPGMGNSGHPVDPGDPPVTDTPAPDCLTIACTVANTPPQSNPLDPDGGSSPNPDCTGDSCGVCTAGETQP